MPSKQPEQPRTKSETEIRWERREQEWEAMTAPLKEPIQQAENALDAVTDAGRKYAMEELSTPETGLYGLLLNLAATQEATQTALQEAACMLLEQKAMTPEAIARGAGVSRATLFRWRRDRAATTSPTGEVAP